MTAASSREATAQPNSTISALRAVLRGPVLAAIAACCVVGVEAYAGFFSGSFFTARILVAVALFWSAVAVVAALAVSALVLPLVVVLKGRARAAILPAIVAGATLLANALAMSGILAGRDSLGGDLLLSRCAAVSCGLLYAVVVAVTTARAKNAGHVAVSLAAIACASFAAAASFLVWTPAAAITLTLAPFPLFALTSVGLEAFANMRIRAAFLAAAFVVAAAGLAALGYSTGQTPLEPLGREVSIDPSGAAMVAGKPSVVIAVIDTMRADHTSLCGYEYPTTPNLVKLASDCRFFPYGESVDSWTLTAHASLFTGKYPRQHGAHALPSATGAGTIQDVDTTSVPLAPSQVTLATLLSAKGYNTAGIAANYSWLCRQFGLDQGFAYYYDLPRQLSYLPNGAPVFRHAMDCIDRILGLNGQFVKTYLDGESVTRKALRWVSRNKEAPFFLFLNYMDPHYPYAAPPPFDRIDGPDIPYNRRLRLHPFNAFIAEYITQGTGLTPEFRREMVNQYDGAIAYADHWVGRFIDGLKAEGLYDNTLLIVLSDHGEFLGEHQLVNHAVGLYEGGVRIPILVKYPDGAHAGEVNKSRVSIVDVFATVLDVLSYPQPPGTSAVPLGKRVGPVYAEDFENGSNVKRFGRRFRGSRTAGYSGDNKYMTSTAAPAELYDLASDPGETRNLAALAADVALAMKSMLSTWQRDTPVFDGTKESAKKLSPEDLKRLESLGYIGGGNR